METGEKYKVWEAIDRALHDVIVQLDRDTLKWLAYETETTSIIQDKANAVLDYLDPVFRSRNDGVTVAEAERLIAKEQEEREYLLDAAKKIAIRGTVFAESEGTLVGIARLAAGQ